MGGKTEKETEKALQDEAKPDKTENEELRAEIEKLRAELLLASEERDLAIEKAREQSERLDAQVARQEEAIARQLGQQRKVRIVVASGKGSHERSPVPLAVNGREFLIKRDTPVDVPLGVLNVLDLCQANVAESSDNGIQVNTEFHKTLRFAYRVIGYIDPETGELEQR